MSGTTITANVLISILAGGQSWGFCQLPNGQIAPALLDGQGNWVLQPSFPPILALYLKPLLAHLQMTQACEQQERQQRYAAAQAAEARDRVAEIGSAEPRKLN